MSDLNHDPNRQPSAQPRTVPLRTVLMAGMGVAAIALLALNFSAWQSVARGDASPLPGTNANGSPSVRSISVTGIGKITLKPDLATISLGVQSQASTAAAAQDQASAAMTKIIAALKKLGIADADMTSQWVSLQPQYDYRPDGSSPPRVSGYQATQNLSVKVRKIADAGPAIDAAVAAGANQVGGISFSLADPTGATAQARAAAVADAKERAAALAKAAGVSVGSVLTMSEVSAPEPTPITYNAADALSGAVKTPVQVGTTEVQVTVQVTFAIG
jgi:uncharacterized protein YggE